MLGGTKISLYPQDGSKCAHMPVQNGILSWTFVTVFCLSTGLGMKFKLVQEGSNEFIAVSRFTRERKYNPVYALRKQGPAEASGKIKPGDFLLEVNFPSFTDIAWLIT